MRDYTTRERKMAYLVLQRGMRTLEKEQSEDKKIRRQPVRRYHRQLRVLLEPKLTQAPITVFWRKWGRTKGLQLVTRSSIEQCQLPFEPRLLRPKPIAVAISETRGNHVVFVEGADTTCGYLLYGVGAALEAGAMSVGVLTDRPYLTATDVHRLCIPEKDNHTKISWMWMNGSPRHMRGLTELSDGKITTFPFTRRLDSYSDDVWDPSQPTMYPLRL